MEPLRDRIAEILVLHDPLRAAEEHGADLEDVYLVEADELADLLAGAGLGAEECASVVWAVIAGSAGTVEAGPFERYGPIGADVSAALDGSQPPLRIVDDGDEDDYIDVEAELPDDPITIAVLAILDDRDPAGIDDRTPTSAEEAVEDQFRYVPAAEEIAEALGGVTADPGTCTALAREILEAQFGPLSRARLAAVGVELAELVELSEHVRAELDPLDLADMQAALDVPTDPFCAGILAVLDRHDPAGAGSSGPGAYVAEAEEIADLLRDVQPDSVHCAAVTWAVVRRWTTARDAGPITTYGDLGRDLARVVELYRELADSHPDLVAPVPRDGASLLASEPLARRVHAILVEHDPFGLIGHGELDTADYVPYARELAVRLTAGGRSPGWCQVLAWKVLTEPWGGLGGSLGRFRELGRDLHVLADSA